jgi:thymidylate synthase ThyX
VTHNITVKILADSITDGGARLITWEWTYPRMIHAEIMTHRALSRNAASSRAIPAAKLRERTLANPAVPVHWGANQKGMQAAEEVADPAWAKQWWLSALESAAEEHYAGEDAGLHKQIVNRIIEPWMMITVIVSATEMANLLHQRVHKDAEPNFQVLAKLVRESYFDHTPTYVAPGGWHLPLITDEDMTAAYLMVTGKPVEHARSLSLMDAYAEKHEIRELLKKVSVGRCARVSLLTHDGKRDLAADVELHDRLAASANAGDPMHASPFEHVAMAMGRYEQAKGRANVFTTYRSGNFVGWKQYRKTFLHENGPRITSYCERCGLWNDLHTKDCPSRREKI